MINIHVINFIEIIDIKFENINHMKIYYLLNIVIIDYIFMYKIYIKFNNNILLMVH